eukprot:298414-Chlamydomonas_euryale.AAC.1
MSTGVMSNRTAILLNSHTFSHPPFQVLEAHAHEGVALALAYFLEEARAVRVDALAEVLRHGRG